MPVSAGTSFLIILAVALTTFATRVLPFLIFPKGKEIPEVVRYLGRVLTPAVIGMLVIYCLKGTTLSELPYGIPEGLAVLVPFTCASTLSSFTKDTVSVSFPSTTWLFVMIRSSESFWEMIMPDSILCR